MLETRDESKNNIDYNTFPVKLSENEEYVVFEQYASIKDRLPLAINAAMKNRSNRQLQTAHQNPVMRLRSGSYFDQN